MKDLFDLTDVGLLGFFIGIYAVSFLGFEPSLVIYCILVVIHVGTYLVTEHKKKIKG